MRNENEIEIEITKPNEQATSSPNLANPLPVEPNDLEHNLVQKEIVFLKNIIARFNDDLETMAVDDMKTSLKELEDDYYEAFPTSSTLKDIKKEIELLIKEGEELKKEDHEGCINLLNQFNDIKQQLYEILTKDINEFELTSFQKYLKDIFDSLNSGDFNDQNSNEIKGIDRLIRIYNKNPDVKLVKDKLKKQLEDKHERLKAIIAQVFNELSGSDELGQIILISCLFSMREHFLLKGTVAFLKRVRDLNEIFDPLSCRYLSLKFGFLNDSISNLFDSVRDELAAHLCILPFKYLYIKALPAENSFCITPEAIKNNAIMALDYYLQNYNPVNKQDRAWGSGDRGHNRAQLYLKLLKKNDLSNELKLIIIRCLISGYGNKTKLQHCVREYCGYHEFDNLIHIIDLHLKIIPFKDRFQLNNAMREIAKIGDNLYFSNFSFNNIYDNKQMDSVFESVKQILTINCQINTNTETEPKTVIENKEEISINKDQGIIQSEKTTSINNVQLELTKKVDLGLINTFKNKWDSYNNYQKAGIVIGLPLLFGVIVGLAAAVITLTAGWGAIAFLAGLATKLTIGAAVANGIFGFLTTSMFTGGTTMVVKKCLPVTSDNGNSSSVSPKI